MRSRPSNFRDISGQTFGTFTVLRLADMKRPPTIWLCRCQCGTEKHVRSSHLIQGVITSCGCQQGRTIKHGHSRRSGRSPEFRAYCSAKERCSNPKIYNFHRYGGRGIEFHFTSFVEFLAEIGTKPTPQHSLDRIDVNGHYEPGNVRWATPKEQANNRRNSQIPLNPHGQTK